jgi:hypothetical protein
MRPDETVRAFVPGLAGSAVIVTDRRVFLFSRMPLTRGGLSWWPAEAVISIVPEGASLRITIVGSAYEPGIVPERGAQIIALQSALRSAHEQHPVKNSVTVNPGERLLAGLTSDSTVPMLTRTYPGTNEGRQDFAAETRLLGAQGYRVAAQSQDPGHIHAGRLIATGGLSILAGEAGTRAKGSITVTFEKAALVSAESPTELLKQLGELRDSGVLTQAEFDAKKSAILKRL